MRGRPQEACCRQVQGPAGAALLGSLGHAAAATRRASYRNARRIVGRVAAEAWPASELTRARCGLADAGIDADAESVADGI